ncbi:MAG TPA: phosphatase PAP2 family protein [Candidatus Dormibacteraeota bacterium]|nr:phosphatase PAP2 family protein [Candidatus Dormibacteraeota bacterium]
MSFGTEEIKKGQIKYLLPAAILVSVMALLLFGWIAEEMLEADTEKFDAFVRTAIHGWSSPGLTKLMKGISYLGSVVVLGTLNLLAISLFYYYQRYRAAALIAITWAGAVGLDVVLKHAFHRARPEPYFGTAPSSYGFPSGHALGSMCFYGALAAILSAQTRNRRARLGIWTMAAVLIAMIGFSRVYLGVHYPSDVIAGYCAGVVWVGAVGIAARILECRSRIRKDGAGI